MAEFFIFDWTYRHWMDDLAPSQVAEMEAADPRFADKYGRRYRAGDIKEVYPDGHLPIGATISPATKEVCIKVPGISYETAKQYLDSLPTKRRKYHVDWDQITAGIKAQLATDRVLMMTNLAELKLAKKTK